MSKEFKNPESGMSLGDLRIIPTRAQLFMFSAVTWNRHQIHFNRDQAEVEGFPDVAVQRGLIGNFLAQYVMRWGNLKNLQWKVLQSTFPNKELTCLGEILSVTEKSNEKEIHCTLKIVNDEGTLIATGEAKIQQEKEV